MFRTDTSSLIRQVARLPHIATRREARRLHTLVRQDAQRERIKGLPMQEDTTRTTPVDRMVAVRCARKHTRRSVLLAIGKVTKSGGAPGPYRKPEGPPCK